MLRRSVVGLAAFLVAASTLIAADKEVTGKIVKIDAAKKTLTVENEDGQKDYTVGSTTKVMGPKDDVSADGLSDKRLSKGASVRLLVAGNNRTLHEVHILGTVHVAAKPKPEMNNSADSSDAAPTVSGRIVKYDAAKKTMTIATDNGTTKDFRFGKDTKVTDAKGKASAEGLNDERLVAGATVELTLTPKGRGVRGIQLTAAATKAAAAPATDDKPTMPATKKAPTRTAMKPTTPEADTADEKPAKGAKPLPGLAAKVIKVDLDNKTITVTMDADGRRMEYTVDSDTKFVGPRGGVSHAGMKDDRLTAGAEVGIVVGADKSLKEVHLPYRARKSKDDGKDK